MSKVQKLESAELKLLTGTRSISVKWESGLQEYRVSQKENDAGSEEK